MAHSRKPSIDVTSSEHTASGEESEVRENLLEMEEQMHEQLRAIQMKRLLDHSNPRNILSEALNDDSTTVQDLSMMLSAIEGGTTVDKPLGIKTGARFGGLSRSPSRRKMSFRRLESETGNDPDENHSVFSKRCFERHGTDRELRSQAAKSSPSRRGLARDLSGRAHLSHKRRQSSEGTYYEHIGSDPVDDYSSNGHSDADNSRNVTKDKRELEAKYAVHSSQVHRGDSQAFSPTTDHYAQHAHSSAHSHSSVRHNHVRGCLTDGHSHTHTDSQHFRRHEQSSRFHHSHSHQGSSGHQYAESLSVHNQHGVLSSRDGSGNGSARTIGYLAEVNDQLDRVIHQSETGHSASLSFVEESLRTIMEACTEYEDQMIEQRLLVHKLACAARGALRQVKEHVRPHHLPSTTNGMVPATHPETNHLGVVALHLEDTKEEFYNRHSSVTPENDLDSAVANEPPPTQSPTTSTRGTSSAPINFSCTPSPPLAPNNLEDNSLREQVGYAETVAKYLPVQSQVPSSLLSPPPPPQSGTHRSHRLVEVMATIDEADESSPRAQTVSEEYVLNRKVKDEHLETPEMVLLSGPVSKPADFPFATTQVTLLSAATEDLDPSERLQTELGRGSDVPSYGHPGEVEPHWNSEFQYSELKFIDL
jgi:hypothetical protein